MAVLRIVGGSLAGQEIPIESDELTIGRNPDNGLQINDPSVSGRHCAVVRDGGRYTVRDLGSTNGTRVNGAIVQERRLNDGDVVTAGSVDVKIEGEDIERFSPPAAAQGSVPRTVSMSGGAGANGQPVSPFSARRDSKWAWIVFAFFAGTIGLAALIWFLVRLFMS
jgi:pSer/pThr/pTyr-binding forkhead associated (FHA) protein